MANPVMTPAQQAQYDAMSRSEKAIFTKQLKEQQAQENVATAPAPRATGELTDKQKRDIIDDKWNIFDRDSIQRTNRQSAKETVGTRLLTLGDYAPVECGWEIAVLPERAGKRQYMFLEDEDGQSLGFVLSASLTDRWRNPEDSVNIHTIWDFQFVLRQEKDDNGVLVGDAWLQLEEIGEAPVRQSIKDIQRTKAGAKVQLHPIAQTGSLAAMQAAHRRQMFGL